MATRSVATTDPQTRESVAALLLWWRRMVPQGTFRAQVLTVMSGMAFAQVLLLLFAPVLTRLYDPTDFATLALFMVGVNLLSAIAAGRYEFAVMLPKTDGEAVNVLALAVGLSTGVALITLAVVAAVRPWLVSTFDLPANGNWLWFIPPGVLLYSWYGIAAKWESRKRRFASVAYAQPAACIGSLAVQIPAGLLLASVTGTPLIWGHLLGRCIAVVVMCKGTCGDLLRFHSQLRLGAMQAAAKRYLAFPVFSGGANLLAKATSEVPKLMLGAFFSTQILGFFSLSLRVLGLPTAFVGQAVATVFFPRISECRHDGDRSVALLLRCCRNLLILIAVPMLVLLLWADSIFAFVFGAEWATAGHYTRLMVPMLVSEFVVGPIRQSLQAFEKQHALLIWRAGLLGLSVAAFFLGQSVGSAEVALLSYSLATVFMDVLYVGMCVHYARNRGDVPVPNGTQPVTESEIRNGAGVAERRNAVCLGPPELMTDAETRCTVYTEPAGF